MNSTRDNILAYFIPHRETHQKAKLLSWQFLAIYILLFMLLRVSIDLGQIYKPGILGISSSISVAQVIEGTNQERVKDGLTPLVENQELDEAAYQKAKNMFTENYWAHYSPSGKDPWSFISAAGYKFSYAGENLARNFHTSNDVVQAWMNSPSHRENILGSHYKEIGIAVVDGVLQGENTTLVVQMFGTPTNQVALAPSKPLVAPLEKVAPKATLGEQAANVIPQVSVDPYATIKNVGLLMLVFLAGLLAADFVILKRRGVFRPSPHYLTHFGFLATSATILFSVHTGQIL